MNKLSPELKLALDNMFKAQSELLNVKIKLVDNTMKIVEVLK